MPEIIRPFELVRRQRLGVQETGLRLLTVLGGHKQLAHFAVRRGEIDGGGVPVVDRPCQGCEAVAQLHADWFGRGSEIRQRNGSQCCPIGPRRPRRRPTAGRGKGHGREKDGGARFLRADLE